MSMLAAVSSCWALLLGIALIMMGNGLQGTLLAWRATLEGFSTTTTGLVMTGYFAGFLAGSLIVPKLLRNVGHIRVFAALASLASAAVLLHAVFVLPIVWFAFRLITGFSYSGLYVVAESWLNDAATNETRGQLLSVYMVMVLGGMGAGQFLLTAASPESFELFVVVSVLVSFALIPITLTVSPAPRFEAPDHVGLRQLYRTSPLGVLGALGIGVAHSTLFSMGPVYAQNVGFTVREVSVLMAIVLFGGLIMQWPTGRLSDHFDRRVVITVVTFVATAAALVAALVSGSQTGTVFVMMAIIGGTSLPLYSLFIAHTNDYLQPSQIVAASASLVLVAGVGLTLGPSITAALMDGIGPAGYFWSLGLVHGAVGLFALYRMTRRESLPREAQRHYAPVAPRGSLVTTGIAHRTVRDHRDRDLARLSQL